MEEKELQLSVDRYENELSEQKKLLEDMTHKFHNAQIELDNKSHQLDILKEQLKQEWESKLNEAYTEVQLVQ